MKAKADALPDSSERVGQIFANPCFGDLVAGPDRQWLSLHSEPTMDAQLPIVDAHHHLWDLPRAPYLGDQLAADLGSGHNIIGTVFVQCSEAYLQDGPPELRPVGETKFVGTVVEKCAARGLPFVCSGIVGYADLRMGSALDLVLEAHEATGGGRFRGVRQSAVWDANGGLRTTTTTAPQGLLLDSKFREGFSRLAASDLSFDAWVYHHQLADVADLARTFPGTAIIVNHTGGPIGMGPYVNRRAEVFAIWRKGIVNAAQFPRVFIKLGGLGMPLGGFGFHERPQPPTSSDLAQQWQPYFETCIEVFGPDRCMFESNFPVDNASCSYHVLWNAYKKLAGGYSCGEKRQLFSETATRAYRLETLKTQRVAAPNPA
jgi:L-fuconolactonase